MAEIVWRHIITYGEPISQTVRVTPDSARSWFERWPDVKFSHIEVDTWAWPGGYPLLYITKDSAVLCPTCVNKHIEKASDEHGDEQWQIIAQEVNWEDESLYCDHCSKKIPSAYGEEEDDPSDES